VLPDKGDNIMIDVPIKTTVNIDLANQGKILRLLRLHNTLANDNIQTKDDKFTCMTSAV